MIEENDVPEIVPQSLNELQDFLARTQNDENVEFKLDIVKTVDQETFEPTVTYVLTFKFKSFIEYPTAR